MKDINIHIGPKRQRCELITFAVCFAIAFLLNVYAIVIYNSSWLELITSIFYIITFAVVIYVAWSCMRLIVWALFKRKNKPNNHDNTKRFP